MHPSYQKIIQWINTQTGIVYDENNQFMLQKRLDAFMLEENLPSMDSLTSALMLKDSSFKQKFVNLVVNNETYFFREPKFFYDFVHILIPYYLHHFPGQKIRIWSMACSNGQEPYSLAISLEEATALYGPIQYEIIATDISTNALLKAQNGIYDEIEIKRGLTPEQIAKYFKKLENGHYQIQKRFQTNIRFEQLNLFEPWTKYANLHLLLCRNVLYYFDEEKKEQILSKILDHLHPDGIFVLSATETVKHNSPNTNRCKRMIEYACFSHKASQKTSPMAMQEIQIPTLTKVAS